MPNKIINLDHAAGSPLNKYAKKGITKLLDSNLYNPDSSYQPAVEFRRLLADRKKRLAKLIGTNSPNIFITSGSSDANQKLLNLISKLGAKNEIITTNIEHSTLLSSLKKSDNPTKIIKIEPTTGLLSLKKLRGTISDQTILLTIQYVNNETGVIQPIKEIAKLLKEVKSDREARGIRLPIFLHTDASQAVLTQDIQVPRLGVDALSLNGSKFGALPGTGVLYLSSDILRLLAEYKVELPTTKDNPLSLISLYEALNDSLTKKNSLTKQLQKLTKAFDQEFRRNLPEANLNPKATKIGKNHAPQILNYQLPHVSGEKLVILAGLKGILISTGAACSASKDQPSHVLEALSLSPDQIQSSIRVSLGPSNTSEEEVRQAARTLAKLAREQTLKL